MDSEYRYWYLFVLKFLKCLVSFFKLLARKISIVFILKQDNFLKAICSTNTSTGTKPVYFVLAGGEHGVGGGRQGQDCHSH